jgi:hypothetical protein
MLLIKDRLSVFFSFFYSSTISLFVVITCSSMNCSSSSDLIIWVGLISENNLFLISIRPVSFFGFVRLLPSPRILLPPFLSSRNFRIWSALPLNSSSISSSWLKISFFSYIFCNIVSFFSRILFDFFPL